MAIHVPFSQRPSGQQQVQPIYIGFEQPRRKRKKVNWWGTFSVVLFFLSLGLLSPITLLMGLTGLGRKPRRVAVAGTVLSLFGIGVMAAVTFLAVRHEKMEQYHRQLSSIGRVNQFKVVETQGLLAEAASEFEEFRDSHQGQLPLDLDGNALAIKHVDPWQNELRYEVGNDGATLRSSGPDTQFFTNDDVTYRMEGKTEYEPLLPVE